VGASIDYTLGVTPDSTSEQVLPNETGVLVRRARRGDEGAMSTLLERYQPRVMRIVRRRIGNELRSRMESGDVVQDAMVEVIHSFDDFKVKDDRSFLRWISGVIENRLRNHSRASRAIAIDPLQPALLEKRPAPADDVRSKRTDRRERELLAEGLDLLSEGHRTVIRLRNNERLSFKEIGERTDRSEDAAFMMHKRAKARLAQVVHGLRRRRPTD
jgi:RNA polymerase sigma factor (sigma-70 family)